MRAFLDTNVLLDSIVERENPQFGLDADAILKAGKNGTLELCMSVLSIPTIAYVVKHVTTDAKKTLIRNLLFAALCAALCVCGTGCLSASVLNSEFGSKRSTFTDYRYDMSPNHDEIILTCKRNRAYNFLPLYGSRHRNAAWTWTSTWEKRIPLDPLPEGLIRCSMIVETDPEAERLLWADNHPTAVMEIESLPLREGETFYLKIHPQDRERLSKPFQLRLVPKKADPEDVPTDADETVFAPENAPENASGAAPENAPETKTAAPSQPECEKRLMFPVSVTLDGSRYELLTLAPEKMTPVNPFRKIREDRIKALEEKRKEAEQKRAQGQDGEQDGSQEQRNGKLQSWLILPLSGVLAAALLTHQEISERGKLLEIEEKCWDFQEANRFPGLYPFRESQEEVCMIEYECAAGERFPTVDAVLWKTLCLPSAIVGDVILLPGEIVVFTGTTLYIYLIIKLIEEAGGF